MTDAITPDPVETPAKKRSLRNPFPKKNASTDPESVDTKSTKDRVKTGLAYVGGATILAGAAVYIAKKRGVDGIEATLPDVDVNPDAS